MIVICPKCGEDNSDNFRFCGMCGTLLESRVESRRPEGAPVAGLPKPANAPEALRPPVAQGATRPANTPVQPISGPSMLGLNQPGASHTGSSQPNASQPSINSLRENSFSGLDSFLEPEQPRTSGRRILLLVALLAALGGAAWWTYTNYLGATKGRPPEAATASDGEAPAETPSTKAAAKDATPASDASSPQAEAPAANAPERPSENASASPETPRKTVDAAPKPAPEAKRVTPAMIVQAKKNAKKREPSANSALPSKLPAPAAADTGDAAFRKGEGYLYGRGVPENCDEAVKNLKAASAKLNAKARSAFGTMYATGHCVPRDLPTSYLWFALALRVDPNNQILEKDLSAIWNQMTPPERQMATRMKQ